MTDYQTYLVTVLVYHDGLVKTREFSVYHGDQIHLDIDGTKKAMDTPPPPDQPRPPIEEDITSRAPERGKPSRRSERSAL